jgi:hypothetical protein
LTGHWDRNWADEPSTGSRGTEIDGVGISVGTGAAISIADTHVTVELAEDIVPVRDAVHPPIEGLRW